MAPVAIAGDDRSVELKLKTLADQGFAYAIINTAAAAGATSAARTAGIEPIVLIHELPRIIREKHLSAGLAAAVSLARHLVFASPFVRDQLLGDSAASTSDRTIILPQGIYQELVPLPEAAGAVRREFGILEQDNLILGAGYADMRKGFDLFLQLGGNSRAHRWAAGSIWCGPAELIRDCRTGSPMKSPTRRPPARSTWLGTERTWRPSSRRRMASP